MIILITLILAAAVYGLVYLMLAASYRQNFSG